MSAEYLVKRIRKEFPELEWDRYRYIDDGAEHEVIILDERWVFRIPWGYQDELTNEIACLNYLANRVEAGIPIYQYVSRDECLGGYEFLAGKQLIQEHCESLTTADREHVAELLAGLLGDLHKTPLGDVEAFNVPHASKPSLDKATLDSLSSLLGSTVVKALETFTEEYNTEFDIEGPPVFLHGELNEHHILWDAVNHRLNTIDLSSCNIGDPASDFSELWNYGESFLERVYQLYDGPKYPKLLRRAALFYKARPIYALKYALQEDKWRAQSMKLFKRRWAELA